MHHLSRYTRVKPKFSLTTIAIFIVAFVAFTSDLTAITSFFGYSPQASQPSLVATSSEEDRSASSSPALLTMHDLQNATYIIDGKRLIFSDGKINTLVAVDASRPFERKGVVGSIYDAVFNKNPVDNGVAAVAAIETSEGGSMIATYFAPVISVQGKPLVVSDAILIGNRINLLDLNFVSDRLIADVIMHYIDDPMCCPTLERRLVFKFQNDKLVCALAEGCKDF